MKDAKPGYPTSDWVFTDWGNSMQLIKGIGGKLSAVGTVSFQDAQGGMSQMVYSADLSFSDVQLNEKINVTIGDDVLDGGAGMDTVIYSKNASNYKVNKERDGHLSVTDQLNQEGNEKQRLQVLL